MIRSNTLLRGKKIPDKRSQLRQILVRIMRFYIIQDYDKQSPRHHLLLTYQ